MVVCRACLGACTPDEALPLFRLFRSEKSSAAAAPAAPVSSVPPTEDDSLAEMLADVTRLQVHCGDKLPDSICTECHAQLRHSQKFIKRARESYNILCSTIGKVVNGDVDVDSHATSKKIKNSPKEISKIDIVETNCEDICDEIGITIANELKVDESVNNFRGDISIIYNDKAVQVNLSFADQHILDGERPTRINGMLNHDVSPSKDGSHENDECVVDDCYKIIEHSIKEEPEDFEDMESYPNMEISDIPEDHILTAGQIKIEPLSEDDALKFHHGTDSQNQPGDLECKFGNDENSADMDNFEVEYLEEDIKPTMEELIAYEQKMDNESDELSVSDANSLCSYCGEGVSSLIELTNHRKLHKYADRNCALCNKCFKTRKRLKHHVVTEHSYFEFMECNLCSKSFMNSGGFNDHKCSLFTRTDYCFLCNTVFDNVEQLKLHLSTHKEIVLLKTDNSESLLCSRCNEEFKSFYELFAHVENKCTVSNISVTSPEAAQKSFKFNKIDDRINLLKTNQFHSCQHCNETFLNLRQLSSHVRIVHSHLSMKLFEKDFTCMLCLYKFKRKGDLNRHLFNVHRIVSEEKRKLSMLIL